jgi:charged multivesicular body protein 1
MGDKLMEQIFNLKFAAKQLNRQSIKAEKDEKSERAKVKKAIEKGNIEGARIYAQNAIRKKTEQLNYLKLASRLDAVVSKLGTQATMQSVNKNMVGIVKNLERALASNNLVQIAGTMQQFEKQFENLDLQTAVVDEVMGAQVCAWEGGAERCRVRARALRSSGLLLCLATNGACPARMLCVQSPWVRTRLRSVGGSAW